MCAQHVRTGLIATGKPPFVPSLSEPEERKLLLQILCALFDPQLNLRTFFNVVRIRILMNFSIVFLREAINFDIKVVCNQQSAGPREQPWLWREKLWKVEKFFPRSHSKSQLGLKRGCSGLISWFVLLWRLLTSAFLWCRPRRGTWRIIDKSFWHTGSRILVEGWEVANKELAALRFNTQSLENK